MMIADFETDVSFMNNLTMSDILEPFIDCKENDKIQFFQ